MKKSLKLLSLVLAVVMVVCIIPFTASAEIIPSISLSYHFEEGQKINYMPADTSSYYRVSAVEWEDAGNGQPFNNNQINADWEEDYTMTVTLTAKGDYLFSSTDTVIWFNGARINYKGAGFGENEYRVFYDGQHYCAQFTVTYRWMNFDIYTNYSNNIDTLVNQNSGWYIYKEKIVPAAYKYDNAFHFDHWVVYQGNCELNDYNYYAPQVLVGNSRSEIIAFYANHDDITEGEVLPTYTTEGREHSECSTCGYSFYDNVIPKKVLDKPVVKATCGTNTIKLTWKAVEDAQQYVVYQYNATKKTYTRLTITDKLSYTATKRAAGTNYYYLVRSFRPGDKVASPFTTADIVKTSTLCKAPAPKASVSGKTVTLKWAKVTGAKKYVVYKYNAKTKKYSTLRTVTANSVKLTKQPKGTNYYLVRAYNVRNAGSAFTTKNLVKAKVR